MAINFLVVLISQFSQITIFHLRSFHFNIPYSYYLFNLKQSMIRLRNIEKRVILRKRRDLDKEPVKLKIFCILNVKLKFS